MDNTNTGNVHSDPLDRIDFGGFKNTNQEQRRKIRDWNEKIKDANEHRKQSE